MAIEGIAVNTVEQLDGILEDDSRIVELQRYPYGRVNEIPADERGWIFLERFITAVKCATLDKDTAANVVVTRSPRISAQIFECADSLRDAALSQNRQHLENVLRHYLAELSLKRFSASSTDKIL